MSINLQIRRVVYAIFTAVLAIYLQARNSFQQLSARIVRKFSTLPWPRNRRQANGSKPKKPTILGVVMTEKFTGNQTIQAIARILTWALFHHFEQVFLYEPTGALQKHSDDLEQQMHWIDPHQQMAMSVGWREPVISSRKFSMGVALLSAADAEWPLTSSELSSNSSSPENAPLLETNNSKKITKQVSSAPSNPLEQALAAPQELKQRVVGATGRLGGLEPDLVLVFGDALTLAGYPPWAVRIAEIYPLGMLSAVTHSKLDVALRKFKSTRQRFGR